jgi:hypothetical protein
MLIHKGERPFSFFGVLAPIKGSDRISALALLGIETRILSEEAMVFEKKRV